MLIFSPFRARTRILLLILLALTLPSNPAQSQLCDLGGIDYQPGQGTFERPVNCAGLYRCYQAELDAPSYSLEPAGCDPTVGSCTVKASVLGRFPGNHLNSSSTFFDSPIKLIWTNGAGGYAGSCGSGFARIQDGEGTASISRAFSCSDEPSQNPLSEVFTLTARACDGACPTDSTQFVDLSVDTLKGNFCPEEPPQFTCPDDCGCRECLPGGGADGGPGASPAGGGPGASPSMSGPGAKLYFKARGTGHFLHPKPPWWNDRLGQWWSHDYAETLTPQPLVPMNPGDPTEDWNHVWLLTKFATFREFRDLDADGVFDVVNPKDEYRKLFRTVDGFELRDLDGTLQFFDSTGLWLRTVDKNGNTKTATYGDPGELLEVSFPDQRKETFTYHPDDKLASITEVGIDGVTSRTWGYFWQGDFLDRIERPDDTAWRFLYGINGLARLILVGTDGSERIMRSWRYDDEGNVDRIWRGTPLFDDPEATEKWALHFNNPKRPTVTTVTDPLGVVTVYELEWKGNRPVVTKLTGDCPVCGSGPNAVLDYEDAQNPINLTLEINGRGFSTVYNYNANGRMTSRIEAFGHALERETTWQYDPKFPAFVTEKRQPSTTGDPLDERLEIKMYDAEGDLTTTTIEGVEAGNAFAYQTITTHNSAGQIATIDPPGHGTNDVTTFMYDPTRGNLIVSDRIDPIVGTTGYGYDAFNRRTSVTDPNGVVTETVYDDLDRVRFLIQRAADPVDDLITEHRYNVFGDLFQTVLPEGNVIEYLYDSIGRLTSIERKPDDDPNSHGERTVYRLDPFGNRDREEHQRWFNNAWLLDSVTEYDYSSRCHLDRVIEGAGTNRVSVTEYGYDCNGNLEHIWDANHPSEDGVNPPSTTYTYDALDRLASVTQPWSLGGNVVTSYGYDVQDHLESVTDAEGNVTSYVYSDRDLMTSEDSPVSGVTTYEYDEHGELVMETDARGVAVIRTLDELDRVTFVDYPDDSLDITYIYDDPMVDFSIGRLTKIERDGQAIDYRYDRFGRTTQDGDLNFFYDKNSNRTEIGYPGGVKAIYGYDFADRQSTMMIEENGQPAQNWITASTYHAAGPLRTLDFSNGVSETRLYDVRYHPTQITVAGGSTLLDWFYVTDAVGNIVAIQDALDLTQNRQYGYVDFQYFLDVGNGPWGDLGWTYDKIGNRLSENRDGVTDTYQYLPSTLGGNSPQLDQIILGAGGTKAFEYDDIGSQTQIASTSETVDYLYDDAKRLTAITSTDGEQSDFLYDGRSFLRSSVPSKPGEIFSDDFDLGHLACWTNKVGGPTGGTCPPDVKTEPTYSSEGLLMHLRDSDGAQDRYVLYFAGRPVGILSDGLASVLYLSTDHLGAPVLASTGGGASSWDGGFEPFGADFSGAQASEMFLRFPGQWEDESWLEDGIYYNVHRWFSLVTSQYTRLDPLNSVHSTAFAPGTVAGMKFQHVYSYSEMSPLIRIDPLGLKSRVCCRKIPGVGILGFRHCYLEIKRDQKTTTCGLIGGRFSGLAKNRGEIYKDNSFDKVDKPGKECGEWSKDCKPDECIVEKARNYQNPSFYRLKAGPNSNSFAGNIARACGLTKPDIGRTPGWDNPPAPPRFLGPKAEKIPVRCSLP